MGADANAIEQDRAHADQAAFAHCGGMNDDAMADGDALADFHRLAGIGMDDALVLHIGIFADGDPVIVAAQHRAEPDAGAFLHPHAADQHRIGRDEAIGIEFRHDPVNGVERHGFNFPVAINSHT